MSRKSTKREKRIVIVTVGLVTMLFVFGIYAVSMIITSLGHNCVENIEFNDAIAVDEDGSTHSSGICEVCGKLVIFENGVVTVEE